MAQREKSQAFTHFTSKTKVEWYTPEPEIARARILFGGIIGLDPATDAIGQARIQALTHYTRADDGLRQPWRHHGPLWCNPPYNGASAAWLFRFIREYRRGLLPEGGLFLVNSAPGYDWWEAAFKACWTCLVEKRIPFLQADGLPLLDKSGHPVANKKGSTYFYLGPETARFTQLYGAIGRALPPSEEGARW